MSANLYKFDCVIVPNYVAVVEGRKVPEQCNFSESIKSFDSLTHRVHIWVVFIEKGARANARKLYIPCDEREIGKMINFHPSNFQLLLSEWYLPALASECLCKSPWNWSLNTARDGFRWWIWNLNSSLSKHECRMGNLNVRISTETSSGNLITHRFSFN